MATTTAFSSLPVPGPDDNMEMSSPANRNLDDDIDIDFDDYPGGVQVADDEHMLEDGDPMRPSTGTDDMMEDDVLPGEQTLVDEEVMQDDDLQVHEAQQDEELIDYGEDEIHDLPVDDTLIASHGNVENPAEIVEGGTGQVSEYNAQLSTVTPLEDPTSEIFEEATSETAQVPDLPADPEQLVAPVALSEDVVQVEADDALANESSAFREADRVVYDPEIQPPALEATALAPISVDNVVSSAIETPGTPTDTGLHPMSVRYGDIRMPLFKSRRQPDGLLKDDNLASLSLAELIQKCRQRLGIKIGEDISEDQELVLRFEHLGLMLVEDSRAAFESSLNDILEVYLQLHRNDAVQDIPPLSLTLSLQLRFASSLSILKQAAAGGQGMSNFGFLQPLDDGEYYPEDNEDGHENAEPEEGYDEPDEGEVEPIEKGDASEETAEYDDADQTGEDTAGYELDEFFFEEHDEYQSAHTEVTDAGDVEQPPPGLGDVLHGEHQLSDTINKALNHSAETGQDIVSAGTAAHLDAALGTTKDEESRESSTTVQGDNGPGNATTTSKAHDDFSTFLTDYETEEQETSSIKNGHDGPVDGEAEHVSLPLEGDHTDQTFDTQHFGSEDFLNDPEEEHQYEDQDHSGEHGNEDGHQPGEGQEHLGEEEYYDETDTYGEQQDEEHYQDHEPWEDDEQFHTAQQDFFNGEYYEHGPEHDVREDEDGLDDTVDTVVHHPIEEYNEEPQEDFEDDLGFDEEPYEQDQDGAEILAPANTASPLGNKRSFDEHAEEDDLEFDEREVKKSRAS